MRSSTYASLVTIVFLAHRNAMSKSIESVIRTTDSLCGKLGLDNDVSHMTKYRVITELIQTKILVSLPTKKQRKVRLAQKITELVP